MNYRVFVFLFLSFAFGFLFASQWPSVGAQFWQPGPVAHVEGPSSDILAIPLGVATALPSIQTTATYDRKIYGGKGDKLHLGGFTEIDLHGVSPTVWKLMVQFFGVRSVLDVGCGRGISTTWFVTHGIETLCVEGSHDALEQSMVPDKELRVTEHDFSRGPWWPSRTVDAIWTVEFLEHVGRNYQQHFIPAFRKAAVIFCTSSRWGGWHHVEVHNDVWWIAKMEAYRFVYSESLTQLVRAAARNETLMKTPSIVQGKTYGAQHISGSMKVFLNPRVASLPEHQHLFAEDGCYRARTGGEIIHKACKLRDGNSEMPKEFRPLPLTTTMDEEWERIIRANLKGSV